MKNLVKLFTVIAFVYICTLPIIGRTEEANTLVFIIKSGMMIISVILSVQLFKTIFNFR